MKQLIILLLSIFSMQGMENHLARTAETLVLCSECGLLFRSENIREQLIKIERKFPLLNKNICDGTQLMEIKAAYRKACDHLYDFGRIYPDLKAYNREYFQQKDSSSTNKQLIIRHKELLEVARNHLDLAQSLVSHVESLLGTVLPPQAKL